MRKPRTALLVIDMQNDFVERGALLEVRGVRNGLAKFRRFVSACRKMGVPVIYTRHCYSPKKNPVEAALFPEMKRKGLRIGTCGWQVCEQLKPAVGDLIVDKTRYDAFFKTGLDALLEKRKIARLIITGTMTEVCCESTARSAMMRDYEVLFCSDLTFTSEKSVHERTLEVIAANFGKVANTDEIMEML